MTPHHRFKKRDKACLFVVAVLLAEAHAAVVDFQEAVGAVVVVREEALHPRSRPNLLSSLESLCTHARVK
jgi:hypothetical protein